MQFEVGTCMGARWLTTLREVTHVRYKVEDAELCDVQGWGTRKEILALHVM